MFMNTVFSLNKELEELLRQHKIYSEAASLVDKEIMKTKKLQKLNQAAGNGDIKSTLNINMEAFDFNLKQLGVKTNNFKINLESNMSEAERLAEYVVHLEGLGDAIKSAASAVWKKIKEFIGKIKHAYRAFLAYKIQEGQKSMPAAEEVVQNIDQIKDAAIAKIDNEDVKTEGIDPTYVNPHVLIKLMMKHKVLYSLTKIKTENNKSLFEVISYNANNFSKGQVETLLAAFKEIERSGEETNVEYFKSLGIYKTFSDHYFKYFPTLSKSVVEGLQRKELHGKSEAVANSYMVVKFKPNDNLVLASKLPDGEFRSASTPFKSSARVTSQQIVEYGFNNDQVLLQLAEPTASVEELSKQVKKNALGYLPDLVRTIIGSANKNITGELAGNIMDRISKLEELVKKADNISINPTISSEFIGTDDGPKISVKAMQEKKIGLVGNAIQATLGYIISLFDLCIILGDFAKDVAGLKEEKINTQAAADALQKQANKEVKEAEASKRKQQEEKQRFGFDK